MRIRNWERFQHYSGRRPPWVKLHAEILDNQDFMALTPTTRWFAMTLLLVAARTENTIPLNVGWLAHESRLTPVQVRSGIADLRQCRFVEPFSRQRRASTALDESYPSRARAHSASVSEVVEVEKPRANELVAGYVDHASEIGLVLPKQVKGAAAQKVGQLLREGIEPELIRAALRLLNEKGLNPASLPSLVVEAQRGTVKGNGRRGVSAEDIDRIGREVA